MASLQSIFCILIAINTNLFAQNCTQNLDFNFKPSAAGQGINWNQFPDFSLPFKVVYGGAYAYANMNKMLKSGYSHLSNPYGYPGLNAANRAYIHGSIGTPYGPAQPWRSVRSPWGNDMTIYNNFWQSEISRVQNETGSATNINADIYVFDIEQQLKSDTDILTLKSDANTPSDIKLLNNVDFVLAYKKAMQNLYSNATSFLINNGHPTASYIGSYGDGPIWNTFVNIQGKTWQQWKTDISALNYINYDFVNNKVGGSFYANQTFITPAAYFYYDYPHPFAGEYLAYMLFQIEVNRAWTDKEIMLFLWQKYSYNPDYVLKNIKPWMAEAMAIFPFMAGAMGLWLWEDPATVKSADDLSNYEYFTKGLYRISKFKDYFSGNFQLVETISARDYDENKLPIWRGVYKNGKLFVAAHNPWAQDDVTKSSIVVKYGNLNTTINLTGHEIFMCEYDLNILGNETESDKNLVVYPNPACENLHLKLKTNGTDNRIEITNMMGKLLLEQNIDSDENELSQTISLKNINASEILVNYTTGSKRFSKKVVITK